MSIQAKIIFVDRTDINIGRHDQDHRPVLQQLIQQDGSTVNRRDLPPKTTNIVNLGGGSSRSVTFFRIGYHRLGARPGLFHRAGAALTTFLSAPGGWVVGHSGGAIITTLDNKSRHSSR